MPQVAVANRLVLWARNQRMHNWAPSNGAYWVAHSDFVNWCGGAGPLPGPGGAWALCCWEMPMYAAATGNLMTALVGNRIVGDLVRSGFRSREAFLERGPWPYLPWLKIRGFGRWAPDAGDVVFFSLGGQALAHVVVSLGGDRVVSFGEGPPAGAAGFRLAYPTITTIPALLATHYPGASVSYGRPKW